MLTLTSGSGVNLLNSGWIKVGYTVSMTSENARRNSHK
jgi:hypothetical protein